MAEAKQALKIVKKKWLPIRASKFFNNEFLGECYIPGPEQLLGRTISANLANLTGDIRQQSVTLKFLVTSLEGDAGIADVVSCEMAPSAIRRIVRRGSDRLDESFICEIENGQKVRIKPMIITKAATNSAVHRLLRNALVSSIAKYVRKHTFESLINEVITSKLQTTVKSELKKVYPLKAVEVRALEIVREERKGGEKEGESKGEDTAKEQGSQGSQDTVQGEPEEQEVEEAQEETAAEAEVPEKQD
ncbi:hypothetical protein HYU16_00100 [Candidatus Woesearchaeota archaeon]|nr:hypothetical protein [Candidatus Woesearchaeota archaeon]